MSVAGELTRAQLKLLFAHMPIGFSVADEEDVVRFWAGEGFSSCSPQLIDHSIFDCHPQQLHAPIRSLLADLRSGKKDRIDTIEHGEDGSERIIWTALRDADGTYRGVLETIVPLDEAGDAGGV